MRGLIRTYEIHTFVGGKWKIDSVFDDRDLALFEAGRMNESGRHAGVRVVEEEFDENTQKTHVRTIFRGSKLEASNAATLDKSKETRLHSGGQSRRKSHQATHVKKRRASNPLWLASLFMAIAMLGLGTVIGLRYLSNLL